MSNPNMYKGMPSLNPKGRPAGVFSTLSDTRSRLLTEFTRKQLVDIAASDDALDEFTAFQAQVIIGLAESLGRTSPEKLDASKERERLYDREIGQTLNVNHTGSVASVAPVLSQTYIFISQIAAGGSDSALSESVQDRSLLPAPVRTES